MDESPDRSLLGYGCGSCDHIAPADEPPKRCDECGSVYGLGAPVALLWMRLGMRDGGELGVDVDFDFQGKWDPDKQAEIRRALMHLVE